MKTVHGWAFPDADDFMAHEMKADGTYQAGHFRMALPFVTDRTLAIDGGAHVGTWTRLMAAAFDRVIAVEPSLDTFEALEANMRHFEIFNVELKHCAIGASRAYVSMKLDERAAKLHNTGGRYIAPGGSIRCETIDEWHLPTLGFLKLDVEGSEPDAIKGAAYTIKRCRPVVLFENKGFCKRYGHRSDTPQRLLAGFGYVHLATAGKDDIWGPPPTAAEPAR